MLGFQDYWFCESIFYHLVKKPYIHKTQEGGFGIETKLLKIIPRLFCRRLSLLLLMHLSTKPFKLFHTNFKCWFQRIYRQSRHKNFERCFYFDCKWIDAFLKNCFSSYNFIKYPFFSVDIFRLSSLMCHWTSPSSHPTWFLKIVS